MSKILVNKSSKNKGQESTDFNIQAVINSLKEKRKVFTSEADFQLSMGWVIKELYQEAVNVRMEYCPEFNPDMHIDIMIFMNGKQIPIELKYKTVKCELNVDNEVGSEIYRLKNHGAKNHGCYDYLKDIQRIETVKEKIRGKFEKGYTVFLTNYLSYKNPCRKNCVYSEFSLEHGKIKTGTMDWRRELSEDTTNGRDKTINSSEFSLEKGKNKTGNMERDEKISEGTTKGRDNAIHLKGNYTIEWESYSEVAADKPNAGSFYILHNEIK